MKNKKKNMDLTNKVVVLALDGMDPNILDAGFKKKLFPNLKKIAQSGYYSKLSTVSPPQSPVAWASFITGKYPSEHGIYDFIERDPTDYSLHLSFSKDVARSRVIKANSFWIDTSKKNIPTVALFIPDVFGLPKKFDGEMLLGMGVPDILGTQGAYTLFTTRLYSDYALRRGRLVYVKKNKSIKTSIEGPEYFKSEEIKVSKIPIEFILEKDSLKIIVQNKVVKIKKGEFSDWFSLEFRIDFFKKIRGIARFYLKGISPDLEIYLSPINFDPESPLKPISYPSDFSKKLSFALGTFSTLGFPHDTWALEEGSFDEKAFLKQADSILAEREKIYHFMLDSHAKGILFAYFGILDTISHMFWRFKDKDGLYGNTISNYYKKLDTIVGHTLSRIDKKTTLIVLSDHGFWSFNYEFNMNSWLVKNKYLVLKDSLGASTNGRSGPLFENVNWNKTRAYAAGYNGVFFNIRGREKKGIVDKKNVSQLQREIIGKLIKYKNPETSEAIMKHVYTRKEMNIPDSDTSAPDLILGFYKGIRASGESSVGAVSEWIIKKRESKWNGDHLFDATEVPGVIFINKKDHYKNLSIVDIAKIIKDSVF